MAQHNAASKIPAKAAKPDRVSIPRFLIDKHLRDLHGSHLKVCLILCAQQARAGRNKPFSYSIPKLIKATGLCERAIGMALGALEKNGVIDRQRNPGPTGNRYRINWEEPAATNAEPATVDKSISVETDVLRGNPPDLEATVVVAAEAPRLADLVGQAPLIDIDSSEPPAPTPAEGPEGQGAARPENIEQEAPATPYETEQALRQAEAHPPTLPEPAPPSPPQSVRIPMPPPQPTTPAGGAQKAVPSLPTPKTAPAPEAIPPLPTPKTPPAPAKATQHPPSSILPPNAATLSTEIHERASRILGQSADPTLIQDFVGAAGGDPKRLRALLEEINKENLYYEFPFMLTSELSRRCEERRGES